MPDFNVDEELDKYHKGQNLKPQRWGDTGQVTLTVGDKAYNLGGQDAEKFLSAYGAKYGDLADYSGNKSAAVTDWNSAMKQGYLEPYLGKDYRGQQAYYNGNWRNVGDLEGVMKADWYGKHQNDAGFGEFSKKYGAAYSGDGSRYAMLDDFLAGKAPDMSGIAAAEEPTEYQKYFAEKKAAGKAPEQISREWAKMQQASLPEEEGKGSFSAAGFREEAEPAGYSFLEGKSETERKNILSGLQAAYERKAAGTANQTDLTNISYAEGKGWKPQSADLSRQEEGLNAAYVRKQAGFASEEDERNLAYAAGKGWAPSGGSASDPEKVSAATAGQEDERVSEQEFLEKIFTPFDYSAAFDKVYEERGLGDTKAKIAELDKQISETKAELAEAEGGINDNPWYSEATRRNKVQGLYSAGEAKINPLIDERNRLQELYNDGLGIADRMATMQATGYQTAANLGMTYLNYADGKRLTNLQISELENKSETERKNAVRSLQLQYPDAVIALDDNKDAIAAKLKGSAIYQKQVYVAPEGGEKMTESELTRAYKSQFIGRKSSGMTYDQAISEFGAFLPLNYIREMYGVDGDTEWSEEIETKFRKANISQELIEAAKAAEIAPNDLF